MPAQFHISVLSGTLQPLLLQFDSTSNFGGYDMDASARTPKVLAPGEGKKLQILAEMGWVKLSGSETAGAYAIMEGQTPPGAGPPQHRHSREDEAFYVLEGEYEFNVGGQRIRAPGGTFVFGPRGVAHSFRNIGATPARMLIRHAASRDREILRRTRSAGVFRPSRTIAGHGPRSELWN